jgi:TolA-binding protein
MNSKDKLVDVVKRWVQLDNQINQLNITTKELKNEKKEVNQEMIQIMKHNDIDIFDLKDGQIQYKKEKKRAGLSQKRLFMILSNHPKLKEEEVIALNDYIYQNREETIKETIVRKIRNTENSI